MKIFTKKNILKIAFEGLIGLMAGVIFGVYKYFSKCCFDMNQVIKFTIGMILAFMLFEILSIWWRERKKNIEEDKND